MSAQNADESLPKLLVKLILLTFPWSFLVIGLVAWGLFSGVNSLIHPHRYGGPAGSTAICRDGTVSYAEHHEGACSWHGGVSEWAP